MFRIAVVLFVTCLNMYAGKDTLCFSLTGHYGFIMPHHSSMGYIITSHIPALEFNLFKRTSGTQSWEHHFKYPEKGLSLFFIDLRNPGVTGHGIAINPYVNHPLFQTENFRLHFKTGVGLGYLTSIFDRNENHKNVTIGSHLNAFVDLRLSSCIQWGKKFRTDAGIGFAHFSNGAWSMPNLGYNFISMNLGFALTKYAVIRHQASDIRSMKAERRVKLWVLGLLGVNEAMPPGGKKYIPHLLSFNAYKALGHVSTLTLGVELLNNPARIKRLEREDVIIDYSQNFQSGIKIGHELTMGRTSLVVETGVYFYDPHPITGLMFHRIGVHRFFKDRWMFALSLRTHWARADNFEMGVGYKIN